MNKRIICLLLSLVMLLACLASCAKKDEDDKGAYINMYLTDQIYDLDPAKAYNNESALRLVSLVFDNLFVLDENGKVKKSLAKDIFSQPMEHSKLLFIFSPTPVLTRSPNALARLS